MVGKNWQKNWQRISKIIPFPNSKKSTQNSSSQKNDESKSKILNWGFYFEDGDVYVGFRDGSQWMNHSDEGWTSQIIYDPSKDYKKLKSVAVRDIKAGEEIT